MTNVLPQHQAFAEKYHHIVDNDMNAEKFALELFTDDATFQIGNMPKGTNHEQISAGAQAMFDMVNALKHEVKDIYSIGPDLFICVITVTYTLKNGKVLHPIEMMTKFKMNEDNTKLVAYQAYGDSSPLFVASGLDITADADGLPTFNPR